MSELLLLEWAVLLEEMHMGVGNSIFKNPLEASSQSSAWVDSWLWYSTALPQLPPEGVYLLLLLQPQRTSIL